MEHIQTSHCLLIQSDGFVLFPDKWDDSWLDYDYIGAPWPISKDSYINLIGMVKKLLFSQDVLIKMAMYNLQEKSF